MDFSELQKLQIELDQKEKALKPINQQVSKNHDSLKARNQEIPNSGQPESQKARKEESPKGRKEENMKTGNPESRISGNQAFVNARKPENRKVPKYSTQLEEELQIQVSVYAKMHRMKDYEVVQYAIEEYLKTRK